MIHWGLTRGPGRSPEAMEQVDAPMPSCVIACSSRQRIHWCCSTPALAYGTSRTRGDGSALTHLDFDHADGLDDFPWSTVHLLSKERDSAFATARLWNQERLRELRREHSAEVELFCSHDVMEFEQLAGRPHTVTAGAPGSLPARETPLHVSP